MRAPKRGKLPQGMAGCKASPAGGKACPRALRFANNEAMTKDRSDTDKGVTGGGEAPVGGNPNSGAKAGTTDGAADADRGTTASGARGARLSAALRANLTRRKQQARERKDDRQEDHKDEFRAADREGGPGAGQMRQPEGGAGVPAAPEGAAEEPGRGSHDSAGFIGDNRPR
jgi:hypothetical protein